jgi:hypothetical protein
LAARLLSPGSLPCGGEWVFLIEKGLITQEEFSQKLAAERATYQKLLSHKPQ